MVLSLADRLCDLLIEKKLISPGDVEKTREVYREQGGKISDILLRLNFVTKENLLAVTSEIFGLVPVDISRIQIGADTLSVIPKRVSKMYQVLPLSRMARSLTVAMVDPANIFALDDLKAVTKLDINPVLADREDMREAIARFYEKSADEEIGQLVEGMTASEMEMVTKEDEEEMTSGELMRIVEEAPVVKLANLIIGQAVMDRASDIMIEPMEKDFRVRYRIDGVLYVRHTPPKKYHRAIISRLKVMSNLNIAETRLPQDGRFQLRVEDRRVDFRLSIIPSIMGEKASLRVLDRQQIMVDIAKLGLRDRDRETICSAGQTPHGMILVCGPTGSGKTTTLYSVLKYVDSPTKNLVTVEDPVEYEIKGIGQVSVNAAVGLTFSGCLRSILRQDPDVIMVGEIRDYETVDTAIKSALTGHLVLSTLHTNTASGSVVRLMNMGVEPFLIASSVIIIVAQRLIRKLCSECKEAYTPSEEFAKKHGLFDSKGKIATIYKPAGCERCLNSGYSGRIAIVECMKITPAIKELLFRKTDDSAIRKVARKEGMVTLRENGMESVIEGITSVEEVVRVTSEERDK